MIILFALLCASVAILTGIVAVGSGTHFRFDLRDLAFGRKNARLYVWVVSSSIFSILHAGMILDYGLQNHWAYRNEDDGLWLCIHAGVGMLFTFAHMWIADSLRRDAAITADPNSVSAAARCEYFS